MALSFFKDIVLEIVVIITTFLLWHEDNVSTPLLIEFIAEKTIRLGVLIYQWCTAVKWYMQLRRAAKFRKFTIIARRSIASIIRVPGRISHSLEDVCLDASIVRRSIYIDVRTSKSLTTLIINDSRDTSDTNDYDSIENDLSVAEKSMRILSITAEDVMDARARIQERSYWSEQDATAKTSEAMEEVLAEHSLEKDEKEMDASAINESTATNYVKDIMDYTLRKEDILQFPLIAKELKKEDSKTVSDARKKEALTKKQKEEISSIKIKKIVVDEGGSYAESAYPSDSHTATKIKDEESKKLAKMQCSSSKDAREITTKSSASLVKLKARPELEEKHCCISKSTEEERIDQVDQRRYICQNKTKLMSVDSSESNKECFKSPESSSCHHEKNVRSIDIDNKIIEHDVGKRQFVSFMPDIMPNVDTQKDKFHEYSFAFRYSKYRLMKQIQKFEASSERSKELVTWGSMSLAQTAHPSGYERNAIAIGKSPAGQKHVQTETFDDSCDSLRMLHRLRHITQTQGGRSSNLRSVYNVTSFKTNAEHEKMIHLRTLKAFNNRALLERGGDAKACKKHDFSQNHISIEDRKAAELRALKAYNKLTLMKDKKKLEMRRKRDSSLINQRSTKEPEALLMKSLRPYNDLALLEDRKEMETKRGDNLLLNCKGSSEEASALGTHNELTLSEDRREPKIRRKYNLSKHETSAKYEESIETPTSTSDHFSEANYEETTSSVERSRQITSSNFDMNNRGARHAHMSLNLREITRNIEWTLHPTSQGIILTNKNLHSDFLENGRFRDIQQRDIVDDDTANALHGAFFYKSEITRIFRAVQLRISEPSFPSLSMSRREDFDTEFVCRVHNEMAMLYQDSLANFNLERLIASRNDFGSTLLPDSTNDNRVSNRENNRDLCMLFIDRQQVGSESDTVITENSATESWEDARSSTADVHTTRATNDDLPLQLIVNVLRNFGAEVSEGSIHVASSIEHLEEHGNVSNRSSDESFEANKYGMFDDKRALNMSNNCSDDEDVSSINSSDIPKSQDEKYLSTIDINVEKKIYERDTSLENSNITLQLPNYNNNDYFEFGTLTNITEKSSCSLQNSSQLSLPGPSLSESANYCASRSNDEELQKLIELPGNEVTLENEEETKLILNRANGNTISQFQSAETLQLKIIEQGNEESHDETNDVYEIATDFTTDQLSKINSNENLVQQNDSFDSTYERNNGSETPVSLEDGSLLEEFSNDTVSPRTVSNASVRISA
ncbi:uncharacterized protein LOC105279985 [Ooceraea biroi]|nr:uncharacterized protein LOC105279985 [Ooceraea biroi]